ncbi:MAG: AI-2E family transporter [Candidatus Krumholzibacteria bacterium]|nr:AI-2E family transporter [Candidatus Krumholzibacteria bacterium]MDH4335870.1 AI-2E family transporter [Candidatus Krumholzibacteria bacterium]MDH5270362.1 AI-2E family transporter [Candidatus Krumholzibacteria bacterium]MDH5626721.1 AI-2E family transporter [Candidatus Krumholzibacteria bacterium]
MSVAEIYRRNFLSLLLTVVSVAFIIMLRRFLVPLVLAAIFAALVNPMYKWLERAFRGRRALASITTILIVFLLVVVPLTFFAGVLVSEAVQVSNSAVPWIQKQLHSPDEFMQKLHALPFAERLVPYQSQILQRLAEAVRTIGSFMVDRLSDATRGTIVFFFNVAILLYAMFFFLMDGRSYLDGITRSLPLSPRESARIVDQFVSVTRAALTSTVVIGVIQGTLGGIALGIMGVPGAVFWGTLMAVLSMIPGLGTAIVWVPVCIYLFATGRPGVSIGLAVYFALVVGSVDNLLRPRLVGKGTQMPDLLVLLSTLGGLMMFGAVGFILGPVLAALFVTTWNIFNAFVQESRESA